jgi:hypothetical protein
MCFNSIPLWCPPFSYRSPFVYGVTTTLKAQHGVDVNVADVNKLTPADYAQAVRGDNMVGRMIFADVSSSTFV